MPDSENKFWGFDPNDIHNIYAFRAWLETSKKGERCSYHFGNLMKDRQLSPRGDMLRGKSELDALATAAMKAAENGEVILCQRRHDNHLCEYIAVRV